MRLNIKKVSLATLGVLVLYGVLSLGYMLYRTFVPRSTTAVPSNEINVAKNSHDGTYTIDGQKITLTNGFSETTATPGSASKIITRYFGNDVAGDFDLDGRQDLAFIISQDTGGSGMFYYVVALLNKANGEKGTQGALLGDRIAPQTLELSGKNTLIANFAERKRGESFTAPPSVSRSLYLRLDAAKGIFLDVSAKQ